MLRVNEVYLRMAVGDHHEDNSSFMSPRCKISRKKVADTAGHQLSMKSVGCPFQRYDEAYIDQSPSHLRQPYSIRPLSPHRPENFRRHHNPPPKLFNTPIPIVPIPSHIQNEHCKLLPVLHPIKPANNYPGQISLVRHLPSSKHTQICFSH